MRPSVVHLGCSSTAAGGGGSLVLTVCSRCDGDGQLASGWTAMDILVFISFLTAIQLKLSRMQHVACFKKDYFKGPFVEINVQSYLSITNQSKVQCLSLRPRSVFSNRRLRRRHRGRILVPDLAAFQEDSTRGRPTELLPSAGSKP